MPIKFRCQHCQQFLGISHTKAGGVVDCPSCGRSIRVPQIDGTIEPVPEPSLIKGDSKLEQAFDQLADLNEPVKLEAAEPQFHSSSRSDSAVLAPPPVAKSLALPPVPAPKPVKLEAKNAVPVPSQKSAEEELLDLAKSLPADESEKEIEASSKVTTKKILSFPITIGLISIASVVAFACGYLWGSAANVSSLPEGENLKAKNRKLIQTNGAAGLTSNWMTAITGRITYRSETGESRPDRGARVIIFPSTRKGTVRISAVGLRPGDADVDFNISKTSLQLAGANLARVDDEGKFSLKLPGAGNYQILVVSRFVSQNLDDQTDSKMEKTLSEFFLKPAEVTGKLATVFGPVSFNGDESIKWDHAFEAK